MGASGKLTAEQKGILLKNLLSFLIEKDSGVNDEDITEFLLNKTSDLKFGLGKEAQLEQIESATSLCVRAEWLKRTNVWKITEHGKKAYQHFVHPIDLFQEMAVQAVIRNNRVSITKPRVNNRASLIALSLAVSPCTLIGLLSADAYLFVLAVFAIVVLAISCLLYNSRSKSIIWGRILMIEFLVLCFILVMDVIFADTSLGGYFKTYFWVGILIQIGCISVAYLFPRFFSKVFEHINQSKWLIFIAVLLLEILFGARGRGGMLEAFYGKDVAAISGTIIFLGLTGMGMLYILGGVFSELSKNGYFD